MQLIKPLGLLTFKPIIYATNLSEDELSEGNLFSWLWEFIAMVISASHSGIRTIKTAITP